MVPLLAPGPARDDPSSGATLLELMVTITLLVVAFGAAVSTIAASRSLGVTNQETRIATEAAHAVMADMKGETFSEVFARFNVNAADDPPGAAAGGAAFAVPRLRVRADDTDVFVGEILFPGDGTELREDVVDAALGMPRDLNGDGDSDAADHALDYGVLPVRVRLRWTGETGDRELEFVTTLVDL